MWESLVRTWQDPQALPLNLTNAVFGLVCVLLVLAVAIGILLELSRRRRVPQPSDPKRFRTPELGVTMADGGEPVDPPTRQDE